MLFQFFQTWCERGKKEAISSHNAAMVDFLDYYDEEYDEINVCAFMEAEDRFAEEEKLKRARGLEEQPVEKEKRTRLSYPIKDSKTSQWYIDYVVDERGTFSDPDHRDGKLFRFRFFFSLIAVRELIDRVRTANIWKRSEATGPARANWVKPLELLVLATMRHIARNLTLDDLYEATFISPRVLASFFKVFFPWYVNVMFPLYVKMPEPHEVEENGREYARAGVPNTVCSVDGVHTHCWSVSANLKQFATGKEKRPTRGFNASCNKRNMFLSCTKGFYGSIGDQTTIRFDKKMQEIASGKYADYETFIFSTSVSNDKALFI